MKNLASTFGPKLTWHLETFSLVGLFEHLEVRIPVIKLHNSFSILKYERPRTFFVAFVTFTLSALPRRPGHHNQV